jgi:hypothetical protein
MSDFLSNLIARSFSDAPAIQPRVASLFETAADEFFDEPQSSTPAIAARETATTKSVANDSDARAEESLPRPDAPAHQNAPGIAQPRRPSVQTAEVRKFEVETNKVIVPVNSFRDGEKYAAKKKRVSQALSEPRPTQSRRRKDFSPVEQRPSTSAPIIRVTIGRVEVRAIHAPAPTPKPAKPPPPKLSLENYLRQRERGSR